jgi:hypothetical protein
MAGVKVTDLPVLGAAASDDVLYIVDTSDNLSKQIEVGDLTASLDVSSGTWTPIFTNATNACSNPAFSVASYSRVGSIVTCSIYGTVDLDFSSLQDGTFQASLPIPTTSSNSTGVASIKQPNQVNGSITNGGTKVAFRFLSLDTSFVIVNNVFSSVFQYEIN